MGYDSDTRRKSWAVFVAIFFAAVASFYFLDNRSFRIKGLFFAERLPMSVVGDRVGGVDYYPELARSFLAGHTYLPGPYHPAIYDHPDPYGAEAHADKIIIQDASFYKGKYYLYFGPLPVLPYVAVGLVTGHFPTDKIISIGMFIIASSLFLSLLARSFRSMGRYEFLVLLTIYNIMMFNPLFLDAMKLFKTHMVSRFAALCLIISGFLVFMNYIKSLNGPEENAGIKLESIILGSTLLSLALLCKINFVLDAGFLIAGFLFYLFRKGYFSLKLVVAAGAPLAVCLSMALFYNYIRFDSIFETGAKYQTNGVDLIHNKLFYFMWEPGYNFYMLVKRTYEYFLMPFSVGPNGKILSNFDGYPFAASPKMYTGGFRGILCLVPAVGVVAFGLLFSKTAEKTKKTSGFSGDHYFAVLAGGLFLLHYLPMVFFILGLYFYATEFLPFLGLLAFLKREEILKAVESSKILSVTLTASLVISMLLMFSI